MVAATYLTLAALSTVLRESYVLCSMPPTVVSSGPTNTILVEVAFSPFPDAFPLLVKHFSAYGGLVLFHVC